MFDDSCLFGIDKVRRKQAQPIGARLLGCAGILDRDTGSISAACKYRNSPPRFSDRGLHDPCIFLWRQREEFSRPARGKKGGGIVFQQPANVLPESVLVKFMLVIEMRNRKGKQSFPNLLRQFGWVHHSKDSGRSVERTPGETASK